MSGNADVLIVGCGLCGGLIARKIAERGFKVCIIEKRDHIAGNMYDEFLDDGNYLQRYGPHSFHTNNKVLFEEIKPFSQWDEFRLTCKAVVQEQELPSPFNFAAVDLLYDRSTASKLKNELFQAFPQRELVTILELLSSPIKIIREYAELLFEEDYRPYTAKQWGIQPEQIAPSVLQRVPIRLSYKDGYFDDVYQYMPRNGFTSLFMSLLDHPNIELILNQDATRLIGIDLQEKMLTVNGGPWSKPIVYTGAIDGLFHYKYGKLPYRSLRFEYQTHSVVSFQSAPVIAYPKAEGFTRITEYNKFLPHVNRLSTVIAHEYPLPFNPQNGNKLEPYYPVLTEESNLIYNRYLKASNMFKNLFLCGRLADYKYYNMDNAIERALEVLRKIEESCL